MLCNLEKVRKEKGVSLVDIADLLKVRYQTVSDKIKERSDFSVREAILIQETFFSEYELKFLFEPNVPTKV